MVVVRPKVSTPEQRLARIGGCNHGVVTIAQLREAGITPGEIKHRVRIGALIRVHRGVYRVGHAAPNLEAHYLAAVRACGNGAVLSGHAAAHLHGLVHGPVPPPEVTALTNRCVRGVRARRARRMDVRDVAVARGIPVTTVPRTLVDLAPFLSLSQLARLCHEAQVRYRTTPARVEAVLARNPGCRGARKVRVVIGGEVPVTLSRLETAFLALLRANDLPLPQTNVRVGGHRVDCRWPEHGLTVELDSYRFHNSRHAWEQDRRRERAAHAREDVLRRYTYGDVFEDPGPMLRELRRILGPATAR